MKIADDLNRRIMLAALIWGFALHWGHDVLMEYLSRVISPPLFQFTSTTMRVLFMMLYPLLVTLIMRQRTSLWINPLMYGLLGSMLGSLAFMLVWCLCRQLWSTAVLFAFMVWFIWGFIAPRTDATPALEKERNDRPSVWEELNSLSLLSLVFLRVPFLLDNAR
jgi:hypothetical protein